MLVGLSIHDVVLIERLSLSFEPGLTVLTGETGAGKSILLDALSLALGDRAESGLVRRGAQQAMVAASFDLPPNHPAFAILADAERAHDVGDGDVHRGGGEHRRHQPQHHRHRHHPAVARAEALEQRFSGSGCQSMNVPAVAIYTLIGILYPLVSERLVSPALYASAG